jgi:exodeoxyribonuclease-5
MRLTLTSEQHDAVRVMRAHLRSRKAIGTVLVLSGYAGTGKTTIVQEALRGVRGKPLMIAPTHKAKRVLASKVQARGEDAELTTMVSALNYQHRINEHTGGDEFVPPPQRELGRALSGASLGMRPVIVDEISMIGHQQWTDFMACVHQYGLRVIAMGDPLQLPPIGEPMSSAFLAGEMVELTKVMRSAGVLTETVLRLREAIPSGDHVRIEEPAEDKLGRVVVHNSSRMFVEDLVAQLRERADAMAVAWRNRSVTWINDYCRSALVGENAAPFVPGERLVARRPFSSEVEGTMLITEQRFWIERAQRGVVEQMPCWMVDICTDEGLHHHGVPIMDRSQARVLAGRLRHLANGAAKLKGEERRRAWEEHYRVRSLVVDAVPSYATTVHRSQGSTWERVYMAQGDICDQSDGVDRNKLLYVAASRAAKELHVCG